ncbi:MAG TPA: hypothetical protein VG890_15855 [Puia sp.]|nr:hypothetical protein [Puia sp.]
MKTALFIALAGITALAATSCNGNSSGSRTEDTTVNRTIPPASDNTNATNPSIADTAYARPDSSRTDSSAGSKK